MRVNCSVIRKSTLRMTLEAVFVELRFLFPTRRTVSRARKQRRSFCQTDSSFQHSILGTSWIWIATLEGRS